MSMLTESARKELDRMHSIFENSFISKDNIGNHGNPEGKGTATGSNTTKNNAPFEEKATATLDKDMKKKDLCAAAGISHASMAKLGKNENVTTDVLVKICTALQCDIGDIMEITENFEK